MTSQSTVELKEFPAPTPAETGVGEWCAPGPAVEQEKRWLLRFEDRDIGDAVFTDEDKAREAFARAEGRGWNCHLFEHCRRAPAQVAAGLTDSEIPLTYAERQQYIDEIARLRAIEAKVQAAAPVDEQVNAQ